MTIDIETLSGSEFAYDYREIPELCEHKNIEAYCATTRQKFGQIARGFDDNLYTQWVARSYLALKYILGATMLAASAQHSEAQNLKVTLPYLKYYTLLNCSRAFLLMSPDHVWKCEASIEATHSNIINSTANELRKIDKDAEQKWGHVLRTAQHQREMFSYRFPATGPFLFREDLLAVSAVESLARFLTELAQLNSACLEAAVRKKAKGPYTLLESDDTWSTMKYAFGGQELVDDDDHYRMGKFARKISMPIPLTVIASHGLLEDFFGAWCAEESSNGLFDPDDHWTLLLDSA